MDVRSCRDAGTTSREAQVRSNEPRSSKCALSRARPENSRFLLTDDFHGCRLTGSYSLWTSSRHLVQLGAYAKHGENDPTENDRTFRRGLIHVMSRPWSRCVYVSIRSGPLVDSADTVGSFIYFFATWLNRHNSDRSTSCIAMTSPSSVHPGTRVSPRLSNEIAVTLRPSEIAGW